MPTINKSFLLRLVLVLVVCVGALFGVHAIQASRIPDALKRQADRAADAGKLDAAVQYLRQYLEFKPDDVESQVKLAELIRRRTPSARGQSELVFLYDRILRNDPDRHAIRRDALVLCLRLGRFSDAVTHAEVLLKPFPTEAVLWQQLATAQAGLNRLDEACKSYETAITHAPQDMSSYRRLTQLLWKTMKRPAEAKKVLDRMAAAIPGRAETFLVRAEFLGFLAEESPRDAAARYTDQAIADLHRVFELDPENADASLQLSRILQQGRDVPGAHAMLRDAVGLYPRDVRLVRSLAWMELVRGNVPAATAVLEDGIKSIPDGFDLVVSLADVLVQQGDTARTTEMLARLEARIPSVTNPEVRKSAVLQAKYLRARLAIRQAKWAEAIGLLEAMRTEITRLPALETQLNMLLAGCFQKTGDLAAEESAYKRVVAAEPANVPAHVALATLDLNAGRFAEAARELETASQSAYASGGLTAQWVRLRARMLRLGGGSPAEWQKLEQAVAVAAPKFGPVSPEPVVLLAEIAAARGKYADAAQLLRKELGRRPGDARLWAVLAERTAEASGTAAGLAVIDEAQAAAGDGPELRLMRASLYAREPGRFRPILPLGERIDSWSEADQMRLLTGLVDVFDQLGDAPNAIAALRRIALRRPTDAGVWLKLHERATAAKDENTTAEARAAIGKIDGANSPNAAMCDAVTAKSADKLVATFGSSPNRADACLALAALVKDVAEVVRLTERAVTLEPMRYETNRASVALLCRTTPDRAAKVVARLAADPRWAGEPFRRVIDGAIQLHPEAIGVVMPVCKSVVEREPGGLGWLASHADADALLAAAVASPVATADDWHRLARHHVRKGAKDVAAETMRTARGKLRPMEFFALAAAFRETPEGKDWMPELKDAPEKRAFAQTSLAVKLSRSESAAAVKMLEAYIADKSIRDFDAAWGKRNLAMLYAVNGKPEDRQRAMNLIAEAGKISTTPEEFRATASVLTTLARYLEGDDRKTVLGYAATALEEVYKSSQSPHDLFNLSKLYRAAGDRAKSRNALNDLMKADQKNIYYLTAAIEEITEEGDYKTGDTFAAYLIAHHRGEFRAVSAVARFECKAGRPERALALAEQYARVADASAGDYLARSARVAELLDELVRYPNVRKSPTAKAMTDAAVERYAALVPSRPEAVVAVASVLAAQQRADEAFAHIDTFARLLPSRVKANAGLAALRGGAATERQVATVRGWLDTCAKEDSNSIAVQLSEAEFCTLTNNSDGAVMAYESVLKADPRNVVALNNLAWILAANPTTAERARDLLARAVREIGLTGELLDTRARVQITLKLFAQAERDSQEALRLDRTPLRLFHFSLVQLEKTPSNPKEAGKAFAEARAKGLEPKVIHPADLPVFRTLDAARQPGN